MIQVLVEITSNVDPLEQLTLNAYAHISDPGVAVVVNQLINQLLPVDIAAYITTMVAMTVAVSFNGVSADNFFKDLSFEAETGSSVLIVTSREDETTALLNLITGLSLPLNGKILIFGQSLAELSESHQYQIRQQIGVVPSRGGLISNLKLWENITLPLLYTSGQITQESEDQALNLLNQLGYSGNVMELPAHLSLYEKRIAAFIRATLCQPKMMVYSNCFEDIPIETRKNFFSATAQFHTASTERTSLYFVSSAEAAKELSTDKTIILHENSEFIIGIS